MLRSAQGRLVSLGIAATLLLAGCSALGFPGRGLIGGLSSPTSTCPTEIVATTDLSCEWWVDTSGAPSLQVVPLRADAHPAKVSRAQAIQIAHDSVSFDGDPTTIVHGQTDVGTGKPVSAWMIVEFYPDPSPHQVPGPCCDGPHWATTNVAGVVISDQTGETLLSWDSGGLSQPPGASASPTTSVTPSATSMPTATAVAEATPFQSSSASPADVPEEIALLDSLHYTCTGSLPPSILWQTANAEGGSSPEAAALRRIVGGEDPKVGNEGTFLPDSGWLEADRSVDRVLYVHNSPPPRLKPFSFVIVRRAEDGSWGFGGLGSGARYCSQQGDPPSRRESVRWRFAASPSRDSRTLDAQVQLPWCGHPTPEQIVPKATAFYGTDAIDILVTTPPIDTGDVACSRWFPLTIPLDQAIGERKVFDAAHLPLIRVW